MFFCRTGRDCCNIKNNMQCRLAHRTRVAMQKKFMAIFPPLDQQRLLSHTQTFSVRQLMAGKSSADPF